MKFLRAFVIPMSVFINLLACNPPANESYPVIYDLLNRKNFFEAEAVYQATRHRLSETDQNIIEVHLDNAFNRIASSQRGIDDLLSENLPDSVRLALYDIKRDNAIKLYKYQDAKSAIKTLLQDYRDSLSEEKVADFENDLALWTALENTPPQTVSKNAGTDLRMMKDRAGLNTLEVSVRHDTLNFIFDTGANLSTTSQTVARQLGMKLIPAAIDVGSITGSKVQSQLAVCEQLTLGNITLKNVVFLVMPDEALYFPPINYQIYGVLGFPVIEALGEVRITRDNHFVVPLKQSTHPGEATLAMDGLTPLIYLDGKHYTFDTGANTTILYHAFYQEDPEKFDQQYPPEKISFAGAGGEVELEGYLIDHTIRIAERTITLPKVQLLKEKLKQEETVYGNIGQDVIRQFDTMIINFDQMFIEFK